MTDTPTRPLPTTLAELRDHYLAAEPETSVSRTLTAIGRLDKAIAHVRELLTQRDERDHELVSELVGAAIAGNPLEPVAIKMVPGDRPSSTTA
jgi:DNA-binding IclR family transcriptional regulator